MFFLCSGGAYACTDAPGGENAGPMLRAADSLRQNGGVPFLSRGRRRFADPDYSALNCHQLAVTSPAKTRVTFARPLTEAQGTVISPMAVPAGRAISHSTV